MQVEVVNKSASASSLVATASIDVSKPQQLSKNEVQEAALACADLSVARSAVHAAEKRRDKAMLLVVTKVLGIKTLDELRGMPPEQVAALAVERHKKGMFTPDKKIGKLVFRLMKSEQRPSWKEEFIKALNESAAAEVVNNTPKTYSYIVEPPDEV